MISPMRVLAFVMAAGSVRVPLPSCCSSCWLSAVRASISAVRASYSFCSL